MNGQSPQTGPEAPPPTGQPIVYYDGSCALCRLEIDHYRGCAGADAAAWVDIGRDEAVDIGPDLTREQAMARFHVRDAEGRLVSGAAGFALIWALLPRWRWAARLAALPGAIAALDAAYRAFLPVRPRLSRLVARVSRRAAPSAPAD